MSPYGEVGHRQAAICEWETIMCSPRLPFCPSGLCNFLEWLFHLTFSCLKYIFPIPSNGPGLSYVIHFFFVSKLNSFQLFLEPPSNKRNATSLFPYLKIIIRLYLRTLNSSSLSPKDRAGMVW